MGIIPELVNLANGLAAAGDKLAVKICRDAIIEIERLQAIVDLQAILDYVPLADRMHAEEDWKRECAEAKEAAHA